MSTYPGQISIEALLISAVFLAALLLVSAAISSTITNGEDYLSGKRSEHYLSKIISYSADLCELEQGSAVSISIKGCSLSNSTLVCDGKRLTLPERAGSCPISTGNQELVDSILLYRTNNSIMVSLRQNV